MQGKNSFPLNCVSRGINHKLTPRLRKKLAEEERVTLETKLQEFLKFKAIGTLAGGISHDFNNLLMGIQGRASLMLVELDGSHPLREHINAIEEYIRSATNLTKQLLGLARGGRFEVKPIDANTLVLDSTETFGRTRKEIRIHRKMNPSPLVIDVNRGNSESDF